METESKNGMDITNRDTVPAFITKDSSTIREIIAPRNAPTLVRQSLAEATIEPGSETQAHYHPNTEEIYYLLRGTARMAIENKQHDVAPGDCIAIPVGARHQIRNTGHEDLVFLCCCVPAYEDADTMMCDRLIEKDAKY